MGSTLTSSRPGAVPDAGVIFSQLPPPTVEPEAVKWKPAIELLTPQGVLAKYFYGIEFSARDIRLGLIEASNERIGTPIDDVLLLCYHYDPTTGKYGAMVLRMVQAGGSRPCWPSARSCS